MGLGRRKGPQCHRQVNRDPLRKVVDDRYDAATGRIIEILECGHELSRREDIVGPTNAVRRRCHKCQREDP